VTPEPSPPSCNNVQFINVEVSVGGTVTYIDCSETPQIQSLGAGPEVISLGTGVLINTLGYAGGTAVYTINSYGPCCIDPSPTPSSTPAPSATPSPTPAPSTTPTPEYPVVDDCGGSASLAIVNNATGISVGYTVPTDGFSDMAVCTINGSPLSTGQSDSFIGAFNSSTYTELTGAGGKQLVIWLGGTIISITPITSSLLTVYGDFGYSGSLVILEIID
jgi:hypothetical protein